MVLSFGGSWEYFLKYSLSSAKSLNLRSILVLDMVGEVREREGCLDKRRVWRINKGESLKKKLCVHLANFVVALRQLFPTQKREDQRRAFQKKKVDRESLR